MPDFVSRLGRRFAAQDAGREFRQALLSPVGERVLRAIGEECRADQPAPRVSDLFVQGRAAGRRDVWLFIQNHLHLDEAQLHALWAGRSIVTERGSDA
jgi:hypothetical protein